MQEAFEVCGVLQVRGKKGGKRAQKVGHVFGKVFCGAIETRNDGSKWDGRFASFGKSVENRCARGVRRS